ncbi:MAG: hypothetical protein J6T10_22215 [Methanobrevibacter sp.]|nr:hypothetical protein [Methanobrevibacter sp.]
MRRKPKDSMFCQSLLMNNRTYIQYYNRLTELALSMFEWKNLPQSVDPRFLEMCLFGDGMSVFFEDEVLGFLALQVMIGGKLNVYRIPTDRRAYASNGYNKQLDETNSVIIFNNYLHTNSQLDVEMFSQRLYNLDRAIDVNANAQKTPVLIQCDEAQRLTMVNLYKQYEGNEPFIFGNKSLDVNGIKVLQTGAPFVADKLYQLKTQIWNEALTYLGISNINTQKKERLITDEVTRNQGGVVASRYSRLESRRQACIQINEMFGLDLWCDYREDFQMIAEAVVDETLEGDEAKDGEENE